MAQVSDQIREALRDQWVVVVEPAINYRSSIKSFLTNLKIRNVKFVRSVEEANRELLTTKIGLFIVEWSLTEINGLQFCRELRQDKRCADIPFLLLTVENLRSDVVLASEVGIDGYLLKPFSFEDFTDALLSVLVSRNNPSIVNLLLAKAVECLRESKLDEARSMFERALEEHPGSARAISGLARLARLKGQNEEAIALFHKALELNPDFVEAYRELVEIFLARGPTKDLIAMASKVNELSPDNPKYTLILAKASLEIGNLKESEMYFKKTVRLSPRLAEAFKGLGQLKFVQEDYQSAMKNFRKAIDLDPSDVSVLNSLGMAYVRLGKFQDGIDKYLAALKFNPKEPRILFNLGYAKEKVGEKEQAVRYYRQALELNPDFDKARRRLEALREKKAV